MPAPTMQTSTWTLPSRGGHSPSVASARQTDWWRDMPPPLQDTVPLLELDSGGAGDARRVLDLALHEARELRRCHRHRLGAEPGEALAHLGRGDDARDVGGDALDHGLRRRRRCPEAIPELELEAWNTSLGDGRHVGQERRALRAAYAERPQPA